MSLTMFGFAEAMPSPIVELNRAVAVSMATGPADALVRLDRLRGRDRTLERYHLMHSVRGDLLAKLDRHSEARTEFETVAALTQNTAERKLSEARARDCALRADATIAAQNAIATGMASASAPKPPGATDPRR